MEAEDHIVQSHRFHMFSDRIYIRMCNVSKFYDFFPLFVLVIFGKETKGTWEVNIRKDLRNIGCRDGNWVKQAQDRVQWLAVVMMVMNSRVR